MEHNDKGGLQVCASKLVVLAVSTHSQMTEYVVYKSIRNHGQSLTLKFINFILEEYIKIERVRHLNFNSNL